MDLTVFEMEESVVEKTILCINLAEDYFTTHIPIPKITFDLEGTKAGAFLWNPAKHLYELQYNKTIMAEDFTEFITDTVPHEVAHMLNKYLFKGKRHNYGWRQIMKKVFALKPKTKHSINARHTAKGEYRVSYWCYDCAGQFKEPESKKVTKCPVCSGNNITRTSTKMKPMDLIKDIDLDTIDVF